MSRGDESPVVAGRSGNDAGRETRDPPRERIAAAARCKPPDFIIIGTQRGGTTSLYRYLTEHPAIGAAFRKEIHFFDRYYDNGLDWYLAHFPERGEYPIVGEASPYYLYHPAAPGRIRAAVPASKFIALLRNPVDRAYSQYHMNFRRGFETLPFAEAIDREPERLAATGDPSEPAARHFSYLARGRYADQLRRWFAVFPREQVLVLRSEELYREPERILHQTHGFLGLPPRTPAAFKAFHESDYPAMAPETRRRLSDYFAPHNRQLYDLLGRDFGWDDA